MNRNDQNPQFQIWLAAYGQRLIDVVRSCSSAEKISKSVSNAQDAAQDKPGSGIPPEKDTK